MTLLSLENFRKIIQYHPWHFWGLADDTIVPVLSKCNDLVYQYGWQNDDAVARVNILDAIETAENRITEHLGFAPMPRYGETTLQFPQHHQPGVWRMNTRDADGRWLDVRLPKGYVQALGPKTMTLLGSQAVTLSDADGDGLDETFTTASVATTETDTDNIAVYFSSADRLDNEIENWRILPVEVTISGGNVTVTGKSWQIVDPIKYEGAAKAALLLDPTVAANFATTLDIYVRKPNVTGTTAATAQSLFVWETAPYPSWASCCGCGDSSIDDSSTDPAAEAQGIARAGIRDSETGLVNIGRAAYNTTTGVWESVNWGICRPPSRVTLHHYDGYPLESGDMAKSMQTAVARFAAAELKNRIASCEEANRELYRWQFDLSRTGGANDESYTLVTREQLNNPFGTRRGHVYAWQFVQSFKNVIGFAF